MVNDCFSAGGGWIARIIEYGAWRVVRSSAWRRLYWVMFVNDLCMVCLIAHVEFSRAAMDELQGFAFGCSGLDSPTVNWMCVNDGC